VLSIGRRWNPIPRENLGEVTTENSCALIPVKLVEAVGDEVGGNSLTLLKDTSIRRKDEGNVVESPRDAVT